MLIACQAASDTAANALGMLLSLHSVRLATVVFVQIWPEAKKRQYKQALDAYEAAVGRQARVGSGQALDPTSAEDE